MREDVGIAAVVVAAGYSSRMGRLKPLLPLGRSTVLKEAVSCFLEAGIRNVRVVVGHMAEAIIPTLQDLCVGWVKNDRYHMGMLTSILAGVNSLGPGVDAFFLLPVDTPLVRPATLRVLARIHRANPGKIIYPCFRGLRGHPPLIPAGLVPADLPPDYEGGLKAFLDGLSDHAVDVDVMDRGVGMDCDTPEEYEQVRNSYLVRGIPAREECLAAWNLFQVSAETRRHCALVARVAGLLAFHLNRRGACLNEVLVEAAGLLHDVARQQPDHAAAGARLLEDLGFPEVAKIVAQHMDRDLRDLPLDETDLVYLADKCVSGDRVIPLEERFENAAKKFSGSPEAAAAISKRLKVAETFGERFRTMTGMSLEHVLCGFAEGKAPAAAARRKGIYLVRHGAVELPAGGRRFIGQTDIPLSDEGVRQADALKEALRRADISAVYCSDLVRCVETARIIAEPHGMEPGGRRGLREIFLGRWEGLTFNEVSSRYPEEYRARGLDLVNYRPPGGRELHGMRGEGSPGLLGDPRCRGRKHPRGGPRGCEPYHPLPGDGHPPGEAFRDRTGLRLPERDFLQRIPFRGEACERDSSPGPSPVISSLCSSVSVIRPGSSGVISSSPPVRTGLAASQSASGRPVERTCINM